MKKQRNDIEYQIKQYEDGRKDEMNGGISIEMKYISLYIEQVNTDK